MNLIKSGQDVEWIESGKVVSVEREFAFIQKERGGLIYMPISKLIPVETEERMYVAKDGSAGNV